MYKLFIILIGFLALTQSAYAVTNNTGATYASNVSLPNLYGYTIKPNKNVNIVSAKVVAACTATKIYLYTLSGTLLGSANTSAGVATFSSPISVSSGTSYYIVAGSDGGSYSVRFNSPASPAFPINATDISFTTEVDFTYPFSSIATGTAVNANFENVVTESAAVAVPPTLGFFRYFRHR